MVHFSEGKKQIAVDRSKRRVLKTIISKVTEQREKDSILSNSIHRILQSTRISAKQKSKGFLGMQRWSQAKGRLPSSRVRDT